VDDVGAGAGADGGIQGRALGGEGRGEGRVRDPRVQDALHQCATVVILDVADPLRMRKRERKRERE
jgi:hypothetical protein